ncbi:unnamed protein product [Rhizophagus irregularis]|uniref:Uncharacterized protein n=1 Tax=Rhizophagus irregularis TaxID=588596 RepID=A0A916EA97_9GLOM|nr:unnamed protein product [Rhizophagus irregularis]
MPIPKKTDRRINEINEDNEITKEITAENNKSGKYHYKYICFYSRNAKILNNKIHNLDQEFPLSKGWALKENLKLGNKGGGKCISKKVVQYLQEFFLAKNLKAADRYLPENMHTCLKELAEEGELTLEEIPTVKTIKGWIGRYSANFKKETSEKALVENMENSQSVYWSKSFLSALIPFVKSSSSSSRDSSHIRLITKFGKISA